MCLFLFLFEYSDGRDGPLSIGPDDRVKLRNYDVKSPSYDTKSISEVAMRSIVILF